MGLGARGEGGELSNKDGDNRANPPQRWFRESIQPLGFMFVLLVVISRVKGGWRII